MQTRAPKRYRDADIAAMQRYRFNPYKEALLNPISGPLVGVPTAVPIDTYRVRVKASATVTVTGGTLTLLVNPVAALCNDAVPVYGAANAVTGNVGPIVIGNAGSINAALGTTNVLSNAPYARASFAGVTNNSSVRGRVVAACFRVCNVSGTNTRNGVFTLFKEPQHNTLQSKSASNVASDPKARQYNASTTDWHNLIYHPVEPEEADGWVWDPSFGPQAGTKVNAANVNGTGDGTPTDTFPGYMGIWWNGDVVSQTFHIELYVIAEYVGSLVQPLVNENEARIEDAQEGRHIAENATAFNTPADAGSNHSGHKDSDTHPSLAQRTLNFGREHARAIKTVAKAAAVGAAGLAGGPGAAREAASMLFSPGTISRANTYYAGARRVMSTPRPRAGYETGGNRRIGY